MPSANRILLASAGSGKTTSVVQEACSDPSARAALITYTQNGRDELVSKAYELFGVRPAGALIGTWYTFALAHFVRPYQNYICMPLARSMNFETIPLKLRMIRKSDARRYFSSPGCIWRDRVTELACRIIEVTNGLPLQRLEGIFDRIYIDEAQDLAGWDLELIEYLLKSRIEIVLVGDHRQAIYATNINPKNKKYWGGKIIKKFEGWKKAGLIRLEHMAHSYRCHQSICDFADALFPDCPKTVSRNGTVTEHDGLYLVCEDDLSHYHSKFDPQPLRYDRNTDVRYGGALNFGQAKGMSFKRTLIYPHGPLLKYLKTGRLERLGGAHARTYVAVTRARQSVAILVPNGFKSPLLATWKSVD